MALPVAVLVGVAVVAWAGLGAPAAWPPFAAAAADLWLLGHGVPVRFAAGGGFTATVALLGPALLTAAAGVRGGRRAALSASPAAAWIGLLVGTAVGGAAALLLGTTSAAAPAAVPAVLVPAAVAGLAAVPALRRSRARTAPLPPGVRAGLAAAALLLGASALLLTVQLLARFADVVALSEGLAPGAAGGLALDVAQACAVPALVVWAAAWVSGAGVALGTGSAAGPFGTQIGPLPALPVLGAVPADPPAAAAAVLLVPVLAGFAAAVLARRTGATTPAPVLGAVTGLTAGAVLGLLALAASGSAGPGRFASVGPDPLLTAVLVAAETGLPALLAAAVVRPRRAEEADPGPR